MGIAAGLALFWYAVSFDSGTIAFCLRKFSEKDAITLVAENTNRALNPPGWVGENRPNMKDYALLCSPVERCLHATKSGWGWDITFLIGSDMLPVARRPPPAEWWMHSFVQHVTECGKAYTISQDDGKP